MAKMTGFKVYKGTKETFISSGKASTYADNIVFITGGSGNEKNSCIFAQGVYFANITQMMEAINFVKGISVGGTSYNAAANGGYVAFTAADPSTVAVSAGNSGVEIGLTSAFVQKVNDTATSLGSKNDPANKDGSAFARIANLAALVSDLTGGSTESIAGQINSAIDGLRSEIIGELDEEYIGTFAAVYENLNELNESIESRHDDILSLEDNFNEHVDNMSNRFDNEVPVTITEAAGSGNVLKTYTFTQNGKTIGTINLAKDVVVSSGAVVMHEGVQCLELTLTSGDVVHIPVTDLVDVYTTEANAAEVQLTIDSSNKISATVVNGSVTKTKLHSDVQTSLGKADTAYQKPSTGIPASDMDSTVQGQLTRASKAITTITSLSSNYLQPKVKSDGTVELLLEFSDSIAEDGIAIATVHAVKEYVDAMFEWEEI